MPYINSASGSLPGVTVSGTAASGKVLSATSASAASWSFPPGFEINYTQITSPVNIASTTEATGTTIISPGAITFDGTAVLVHFFCYLAQTGTTSASEIVVSLFEGATQIARLGLVQTPAAVQLFVPMSCFWRFTPSAASHTYTITAFTTNVTGTPKISAGAGGTATDAPAFVRFTKV